MFPSNTPTKTLALHIRTAAEIALFLAQPATVRLQPRFEGDITYGARFIPTARPQTRWARRQME
jgi:hypothetical protein